MRISLHKINDNDNKIVEPADTSKEDLTNKDDLTS